jgi:ABC-type glycerol-3-phosphate transport system substrate-binding protein
MRRDLTRRDFLKVGSGALAGAYLLGLAGCGGDQQGAGETGGGTTGKFSGKVRAIMEEVPDTDVVKKMMGGFNEQYPDVDVQIEALPYGQMRDRIVSSFLAPEPTYDLIIVDNPWMYDFASSDYLEPLNERIEAAGGGYNYSDFAEPVRSIAEVNGQTYGIPFYNYGLSLIYRKDLFEQAGIQPPGSLDELQSAAEQLKTEDRAGIAMQPQRGYKIFEEWANWLFAAGGQIQNQNGEIVLDSPEARDALKRYIATYECCAPPNSLNWGFDSALRSVSGGNAAMMISYNWMLPTLNDSGGPAGDLAGNFDVAEVPGGEAVLGAWYWSIPANSANKEAAWSFVNWITNPEQAVERVSMGGAPVRNSVMENEQVWEQGFGESYYKTVQSILQDSAPLADGPSAEEMIQAVGTELNAAAAGEKGVDQAITQAATQAQEILGSNGS